MGEREPQVRVNKTIADDFFLTGRHGEQYRLEDAHDQVRRIPPAIRARLLRLNRDLLHWRPRSESNR